MGVKEKQKRVQAYRGQIVSPGRPTVAWRQDRVRFWAGFARGERTSVAGAAAGVSEPVAHRWFRHAGGVNPCLAPTVSGRYLSSAEREDIALWRAQGRGVREIARRLGRSASTISWELRRNASTWARAGRCGTGRTSPYRGDRAWVRGWSPGQIARRLPLDFPQDPSMRISAEAIYQALDIENRGGLERRLSWCLRRGRTKRMPRARTRQQAWAHVTEQTLIAHRPEDVKDRKVAGHWEGDLIIGLKRSAVATLVERRTRYAMLVHLPRLAGYGQIPPRKNGPALAGYGALTMKDALAAAFTPLPTGLRRSLTWDRGKELSAHALFTAQTGVAVYFADPKSPWQRGSNEHLGGLLRLYLPKGTDLSRWDAEEIAAVAHAINTRPRRILDWCTPAEAFEEQLRSTPQHTVATTS